MWHKIKHYLVQTEENKHNPHLLRSEILAMFLVLVVGLQVVFFSGILTRTISSLANMMASVLPGVLDLETNEYRHNRNIAELRMSPILAEAAKLKAEDMARRGYFSHTGPDGEKPWVWLQKVGYVYTYAGENLAVNFVDSSDVTKAWINSPKHKANLENSNFKEIGIGTAEGVYEGKMTTYVVQFFATPAEAESVPATSVATTIAVATTSTPMANSSKRIVNASSTIATSTVLATTASASTGSSTSEVLGIYTSDVSSGAFDASTAENSVNKGYIEALSHPRDFARNLFIAISTFLVLVLGFSIIHRAISLGKTPFLQRVTVGFRAHRKHILEVICVILAIGLIWTIFGYISAGMVVVS